MELERQILSILGDKNSITVTKCSSVAHKDMTIERAYRETVLHRDDVRNGLRFIAGLLMERGSLHDHTKLENLEDFVYDLQRDFEGEDTRGWWDEHLKERHHLNDSVPEDVNLVDVLEWLVDCCVAGAARDGNVRELTIDSEVLERAIANTRELIVNNIKLVDQI